MSAFTEIYELAKAERENGNKDKYEAYMICIAIMEDEKLERAARMRAEEEERINNALELANMLVELYEKLNDSAN